MRQISHNIQLNATEFNTRLLSYQDEGLTFTLSETNYTASVKFESEKIKIFAAVENTPFKILGLIQRTKSHILKSPALLNLPGSIPDKIKYFKYSDTIYKLGDTAGQISYIDDVTEIDITAAYVTGFKIAGLIDEKLHADILTLKKSDRLKVLGAIATNKRVTEFKNGKPVKKYFINDKELRNAWFYIVAKVDEIMSRIYHTARSSALFYYVDGIYLRSSGPVEKDIIKIITAAGYGFKVKKINRIGVLNTGKELIVAIPTPGRPKPKIFSVPERKIITYRID